MATLPTLALGTFTNVSGATITGTEPVLQVIASAVDSSYVYSGQNNTTGTYRANFALADTPSDFTKMGTLDVRLRYLISAAASNTCSLTVQVFQSDGTTALTNAVQVVANVTNTVAENSSVITLTGLDTTANKAVWDGALVQVSWGLQKVKGGDSNQRRVTAAELTGTYTAVVDTETSIIATATVTASSGAFAGSVVSIVGDATVTASFAAVANSVASIVGNTTTAASSAAIANSITSIIGNTTTTTFSEAFTGSVASIIGAATVTWLSLNAILDQMGYRWRNDDGSESAATWAAAINTALPVTVSSNIQKRLRFAVSNTVAKTKAAFPQLQAVKREPAQDPWTQVSITGFGTDVVRGFAYGADQWVVVGQAGKIATSPNGIDWTHRVSSFGTTNIYGVCYNGADQWVAVGDTGKIATSPDGINWTQQTSSFGSSAIWHVIFNGTDQYVAVAESGKLATSPDGETWTQQTSSFGTSAIYRIVYNGTDQYVAVGDTGKLATSPDGIAWTQQTSSFAFSAIWGVGSNRTDQYVAGGLSGKLATSPDGVTWTQQTSGFGTNIVSRAEYGAGEYTAVGTSAKLATSPDGINWTHQTSSFGISYPIWCAAFNGAHQWAVGGHQGGIATLEFTYFDVTTVSSVVRAFDSANVADDADTTQQITTGTFVADNNGLSEDGLVSRVLFNGVDKAEFEYTVEFVAADLADGDEVRFRIKAS